MSIPIEINMEATTMSMTRKGRYILKPIRKAVLSSLMTKAGNRALLGTSAQVGWSAGSWVVDMAVWF